MSRDKFSTTDEEPILEGHLEEVEGGMKLTPTQTNMPDGEGAYYRDGWKTYYFQTLKKQFAKKRKS